MNKDEALRLALEALERYVNEDEVIEGMRGNEPWVETKRIGEKAITAIKAALEAKYEPWEKFCDSHCVWTDHHPDCKLAQIEQPKVRTGDCLRVGVCASEGHKIQPQRKPLTDEEIVETFCKAPHQTQHVAWFAAGVRYAEAAHGIKG
jgi:hypothetical protein